jgi:hypothetical protein
MSIKGNIQDAEQLLRLLNSYDRYLQVFDKSTYIQLADFLEQAPSLEQFKEQVRRVSFYHLNLEELSGETNRVKWEIIKKEILQS